MSPPPGPAALSIAFVIARYPPAVGGTEAQAASLAGALRGLGHRVTVLTQKLPGMAGETEEGVLRLPPPVGGRASSAIFGLSLWGKLAALRPDLIQAFLLSSPALFSALAGRALGRPVVVKLGGAGHYGDLSTGERAPAGRPRLGMLLRLARHFVAPSPEAAAEMKARGVAAERLSVIPNGVDLARFAPPSSGEDHPAAVIFAGRLEEEKGPMTLLEAWAAVSPMFPRARLVFVGAGSLESALRERACRLGDSVRFAGPVIPRQMPAQLRQGSVFVLPSVSEGLSNALLEAMATGLAPVVSDIPGNRTVFPDGEGAVLFPAGDAAALASGLSRLLGDDVLRRRLAAGALQRAAGFSLRGTATAYEGLYRRLVAGAGGGPREAAG